eukprot:GHVP01048631.1.p1 GENE.GHVP01048631.1~~GHVP01048631.1.p1  ORF type:complete len:666 (+),score=166.48 GHVP01048631.1:260-2257(+)
MVEDKKKEKKREDSPSSRRKSNRSSRTYTESEDEIREKKNRSRKEKRQSNESDESEGNRRSKSSNRPTKGKRQTNESSDSEGERKKKSHKNRSESEGENRREKRITEKRQSNESDESEGNRRSKSSNRPTKGKRQTNESSDSEGERRRKSHKNSSESEGEYRREKKTSKKESNKKSSNISNDDLESLSGLLDNEDMKKFVKELLRKKVELKNEEKRKNRQIDNDLQKERKKKLQHKESDDSEDNRRMSSNRPTKEKPKSNDSDESEDKKRKANNRPTKGKRQTNESSDSESERKKGKLKDNESNEFERRKSSNRPAEGQRRQNRSDDSEEERISRRRLPEGYGNRIFKEESRKSEKGKQYQSSIDSKEDHRKGNSSFDEVPRQDADDRTIRKKEWSTDLRGFQESVYSQDQQIRYTKKTDSDYPRPLYSSRTQSGQNFYSSEDSMKSDSETESESDVSDHKFNSSVRGYPATKDTDYGIMAPSKEGQRQSTFIRFRCTFTPPKRSNVTLWVTGDHPNLGSLRRGYGIRMEEDPDDEMIKDLWMSEYVEIPNTKSKVKFCYFLVDEERNQQDADCSKRPPGEAIPLYDFELDHISTYRYGVLKCPKKTSSPFYYSLSDHKYADLSHNKTVVKEERVNENKIPKDPKSSLSQVLEDEEEFADYPVGC